ncbi:hypothetical protein GHT09_014612 [Marmota monax]|uniref:Uncharacterized protein n=1 Tax=Marmota monax TaxID=9995 RepID=A0A834PKS5_MARMO|nr:hypothetical protein GHT09_014612 [Marmota monax]
MAKQIVTVCATLDENPGVRYKNGKGKEAILEEDDDLWVRIRHRHIAVVLEEIPKLMKEVSSTKKATEGKTSLSPLTQMMKKMPHFCKQITKKIVHPNLAKDCMNKFKLNIEKLNRTWHLELMQKNRSTNGTTEENLDRLIHNEKIENESDTIHNWSYLGVPIVPQSQQGKTIKKGSVCRRNFNFLDGYLLSKILWKMPLIIDEIQRNGHIVLSVQLEL